MFYLTFNMKHLKKYKLFESSLFLEHSRKYGSYEGIIHHDIENVKNWFLKRKINYNNYIHFFNTPIAFLNNINVEEKYRNKGYGNILFNKFETECIENGANCIILESDSYEGQKVGFNLDKWYISLGFEIIGNEGGNSIMIKFI